MSDALKGLFSAFARGIVAVPENASGFLMRAEPPLDDSWRQRLTCEQTFKPAHDALAAAGARVTRRLEGSFDFGFCLLTKHRAENLANIARAWKLTRSGGVLVCAGAKSAGAQTVERSVVRALADAHEGGVEGFAKHHGRIFWFTRAARVPSVLEQWAAGGDLQKVAATGCLSRPGIFSWDEIDAGSRLLADALPANMSGAVADLGAGWGYLALELLKRCPEIARLDLYEAEWLALEAARANLEALHHAPALGFHWHDVAADALPRRYDGVVMNPPFHTGRAADVELGRAFVAAAAIALHPGGRLLMVANRHLPYEAALKANFASWRTLREEARFKVIEATR
ncbi:MAG: class I SAM-dependent methyltransferase [Alphaproteobacteria bacterium]|nr:class I SAM-dependent methyltransferase [Alphaproteobacteria bacterium]